MPRQPESRATLGDASIGDAIEEFTGEKFGANGTMTAALVITWHNSCQRGCSP